MHSVTETTGSYTYEVRACDASDACTDWSSTTLNVFRASAPANLASTETSSTDGAYRLTWTAVTGAARYELQENMVGLPLPPPATATNHSLTGKATNSYDYRVRACHTNTACTAWSSTVTVNVFVASAPATLDSDETSSADGAYRLTWAAVTGATSYELQEDMVGLTLSPVDARIHEREWQGDRNLCLSRTGLLYEHLVYCLV